MHGILFDHFRVNLDSRTCAYGGAWIPHVNGNIVQAHGQDMLKLLYTLIAPHPAPFLLDIGASLGSFALLGTLHPGLRVIAFEPIAAYAALLRANVTLNRLDQRVSVLQMALSDHVGQGDMTVPIDPALGGLAFLDDRPPDMPCRSETVSVTTLDIACEGLRLPRIDCIKIDVEGIEAKVLHGGEHTIRRDMPAILLEATNTDTTIPVLEAWGYTCTDYQSDILATKKD